MDGFNMMAPGMGSRREAIPRRSALTGRESASSQAAMPAPESSFMGFMGEIEEEKDAIDNTDWLLNTADHTTLAGGFAGVRIFLTGS